MESNFPMVLIAALSRASSSGELLGLRRECPKRPAMGMARSRRLINASKLCAGERAVMNRKWKSRSCAEQCLVENAMRREVTCSKYLSEAMGGVSIWAAGARFALF